MNNPNKFEKSKKLSIVNNTWFFHILLWATILMVLSGLTSLNGRWPFVFYLLNMLISLPAMIIFSYAMNASGRYLLFKLRKPIIFIIILTASTFICTLLIPLLNHFVFFGVIYPRAFEPNPWFNWRTIPQNVILLWLPYFILSIRTVLINWFRAEQEKLSVKNKQLLAEIQLMKIKLHPHFLFNTLNNLYVMATFNNSKAADYILKLSEIYRIMLYECNKDFYPLHEELKLIENYIELEKIRYDEKLKLEISFPAQILENIKIPPLLFFTFVENAFKHGCRNDIGYPFIEVKFDLDEKDIIFEAKNSIPDKNEKTSEYGGIGLENTKQRLELIYKNNYIFLCHSKLNSYNVKLVIPKYLSK